MLGYGFGVWNDVVGWIGVRNVGERCEKMWWVCKVMGWFYRVMGWVGKTWMFVVGVGRLYLGTV